MKNEEKLAACALYVVSAFVAGMLSLIASDLGGLGLVIVPVILVMIVESVISCALSFCAIKEVLWFGLLFHLMAAAVFFIGCQNGGHEILQPFQYIIDHGHGNFEFAENGAIAWWFLIVPLAIRVIVIEPILLIVYAIGKKKINA